MNFILAAVIAATTPQPVFTPPAPIMMCFQMEVPHELVCITRKGDKILKT